MFAPIGRPFIIGIRGWVRANDCYRRNQPLDELGSERRPRVELRHMDVRFVEVHLLTL